jgi:hypothetical protein
MMYQLRMYTVNRGKMDEWVSSFGQTAVPQMTQYGITLEGAWANEDKTQFIWIRSFADQETLDKYYASPEFNARRGGTASNVARVEFQNMSPAGIGTAPQGVPASGLHRQPGNDGPVGRLLQRDPCSHAGAVRHDH